MDEQLQLSELLSQVQFEIRQQFAETYQVVAEIASLSGRRHMYLELVEKDGSQIKAKCRAILWSFNRNRVIAHFESMTRESLKVGMKVLINVRVEFHQQYGFSLIIEDIDPSFSLGEFERIKQETIQQLASEGLLELNKELELPMVIKRIALISSETAAGYQDFMEQLKHNRYGYAFQIDFFNCLVQGEQAPESIKDALDRVEQQAEYDALILIRGGGSVLDLSCFNDFELNFILAQSSCPVITGIGHERDQSVADLVAHTFMKTPTAAAEFLIAHNLHFEQNLLNMGHFIAQLAAESVELRNNSVERRVGELKTNGDRFLNKALQRLEREVYALLRNANKRSDAAQRSIHKTEHKMQTESLKALQREKMKLLTIENRLESNNPLAVLQKGYSITSKDGIRIRNAEIQAGDLLETITETKTITSRIEKIK